MTGGVRASHSAPRCFGAEVEDLVLLERRPGWDGSWVRWAKPGGGVGGLTSNTVLQMVIYLVTARASARSAPSWLAAENNFRQTKARSAAKEVK